MRTHIGKGLGILRGMVLGTGQAHSLVFHTNVHFAFVGTAMEQVHIA